MKYKQIDKCLQMNVIEAKFQEKIEYQVVWFLKINYNIFTKWWI